ncbi:MAG TPA: type 1 glutamine amidotransferase [Gaiellaceae bacterium]|nr:type 1 glutamine amidotransferase [Gaiellaceae bacterium]
MRVLSIIHGTDAKAGVFGETVREAGHELHQVSYALEQPPSHPVAEYDAAMIFGGSMNTHEEETHPWLRPEKEAIGALLEAGIPTFGVCLGSQLIAEVAGGTVSSLTEPEIGWFEVELTPEAAQDPVFGPLPERFSAFQWHSYQSTLPAGAVELARNSICLQGYRLGEWVWSTQFHCEVTRPIVETWISHYHSDPGAIALGLDADRARNELAGRIGEWNVLGRRLCGAFVTHVEERIAAPAGA